MPGSAHEREEALRPHLDQAQREVASLQAAVKAAEEKAHDAYVGGDAAAGHAAHAEAADLKRQLETAAARLATFETAARAVAGEKQRAVMDARLAAVRDELDRTRAEMHERAAEVWPTLRAAKAALKQAQAAQHRARELQGQQAQLQAVLDGRETLGHYARISDVQSMTEASRLLTYLLATEEL